MLFRPGKKASNLTDAELLDNFRSSEDMQILGELYSRYMHLVYGVCLKYLKEREKSMDAVMQIFEKLLIEIPKHRIDNFGSWLHVVTRNYCLMQLRSEKSDEERMTRWLNDTVIFMENEPVLHPIDEEQEPDMEKRLTECIGKLKEEQKECITQFYFDNRCYAEIAENMNIDEKKVKSFLQNAKRNLKICLDGNEGKK